MDDYMREMMDLKTLVTKTLEKKGVLARIRAELRANVFAAIEEQDRASEGEDGPLALLGTCNERAKKLHATATGKLLSSLVYEYLEWCDLEHTAKVYLPECNLSRGQSRAELEVKLGFKQEGEETGNDAESRPLLLEVLESFLKTGRPAARSSTPVSARSRTVSVLSKGGSEDEDALRELEKQGGNPRESAFDSNPLPGVIRSANRLSPSGEPASLNEPLKDTEKISGRTATNLIGNLPPLRRSGGLTPIGTSRGNPSSLTSSNSSESAASAASRDRTTTSSTRKEELNQTSLDKPGGLRNSEQIRVGKDGGTTEKQSQSRFVAPSDVSGTRDPAYHDDDSASEDNSGKPINASHQQALRRQDLSSVEGGEGRGLSSSSAVRKKATAYVYSDSEDDVSLEVVEEDLIEDVDVPREKISSTK